MAPYNIILEVDWNGQIINSWHSNAPDLQFFCEAKIIVSIYCIKSHLKTSTHLNNFYKIYSERLHVPGFTLQQLSWASQTTRFHSFRQTAHFEFGLKYFINVPFYELTLLSDVRDTVSSHLA